MGVPCVNTPRHNTRHVRRSNPIAPISRVRRPTEGEGTKRRPRAQLDLERNGHGDDVWQNYGAAKSKCLRRGALCVVGSEAGRTGLLPRAQLLGLHQLLRD